MKLPLLPQVSIARSAFNRRRTGLVVVVVIALAFNAEDCFGQFDFNDTPVLYDQTKPADKVAKLVQQLESGQLELTWDEKRGWLDSLLKELDVSKESQTLVFSKTSLQTRQINPSNPRAIYFSDDVYLGFVPGGRIVELSAVDGQLGAVFYSIEQALEKPEIRRDRNECMTCHGNERTGRVPGYLVRSVYPKAGGHPDYSLGTVTTDHTTEFAKRFGGWYVTGKHGDMLHRGNSVLGSANEVSEFDAKLGANQDSIPEQIDVRNYPTGHSDLVALMVLEHQSKMHNLITAANYETRRATFYDQTMNNHFDRPADHVSDTTRRRIKSSGDKLLRYMLFVEEAALTSPVRGSGPFAKQFMKLGPVDRKGRSLRQFDLRSRMFTFPCSYLIYSDSFASLPPPMHDYVLNRLADVLVGAAEAEGVAAFDLTTRRAIGEILSETLDGFSVRLAEARKRLDQK